MNKFLSYGLTAVVAGFLTYTIMPEKIETVEVEKVVEKIVEKQVDVSKKKITKPDGTIIEETNVSSNTQSNETSKEETYKKTETNPKRILVYVGQDILHPANREFIAGFSYRLWGPLDVGGQYNSKGHGLYATIGIRF